MISLLVGRLWAWAAGVAAAITIVASALLMARRSGQKSERRAQDERALENVRSRAKTDEAISATAPDERRRDLSRWVR